MGWLHRLDTRPILMAADRREQGDRRILLPRSGGRRETDPEPSHGTRARYRKECRCCQCRAAEAAYRAALRLLRMHGKTPLGSHVSAIEAQRRIKQLLIERFTKAEIARRLGLKQGRLKVHDRMTLRKLLKLRRLQRAVLLGEDTEQA